MRLRDASRVVAAEVRIRIRTALRVDVKEYQFETRSNVIGSHRSEGVVVGCSDATVAVRCKRFALRTSALMSQSRRREIHGHCKAELLAAGVVHDARMLLVNRLRLDNKSNEK